jgi:hypothetical protein
MHDELMTTVLAELDREPEVTSLTSPTYWDACARVATRLLDQADQFVGNHLADRAREISSLSGRSGLALDALTFHWLLCRSVALVADWETTRRGQGDAPVSRARREVFWTAHHVAEEATVLLRAGFPTGAHARWRAMCELEFRLALLDLSHDDDVAVAYLKHTRIREYRELQYHTALRRVLGEPPPPRDQAAQPSLEREELLALYGEEFAGEMGWAHQFLTSQSVPYAAAVLKGKRPRGPLLDDVIGFIEGEKHVRAHLRRGCPAWRRS